METGSPWNTRYLADMNLRLPSCGSGEPGRSAEAAEWWEQSWNVNTQEAPLGPSGMTQGAPATVAMSQGKWCHYPSYRLIDTRKLVQLKEIWVTNLGTCKHKVLSAIIKTRRGFTLHNVWGTLLHLTVMNLRKASLRILVELHIQKCLQFPS